MLSVKIGQKYNHPHVNEEGKKDQNEKKNQNDISLREAFPSETNTNTCNQQRTEVTDLMKQGSKKIQEKCWKSVHMSTAL